MLLKCQPSLHCVLIFKTSMWRFLYQVDTHFVHKYTLWSQVILIQLELKLLCTFLLLLLCLKLIHKTFPSLPAQLQLCQQRLPHSLDSDVLMANCAWEYAVLWNKDPEVIFALEQALAFLQCIQNALLQHGMH